jgi:hypothetical protein
MNTLFNFKFVCTFLCFSLLTSFAANSENTALWQKADVSAFNVSNERKVFPHKFIALHLNLNGMRAKLLQAPKEFSTSFAQGLLLAIPFPDGTFKNFRILETEVLHPVLAAKFPAVKTYVARNVEEPSSWMRLDITYLGFNAMISTLDGMIFIDPVNNTEPENYLCYYKKDMPDAYGRHCLFSTNEDDKAESINEILNADLKSKLKLMDTGDELRTYRLALACTGEYAATKGGTVPGALSGMVTSVNRVNGIYETEVAVRMVLISNTDTLIFLNSATDPYSNNNGGTMLGQNQTTITARIGTSNYDFGHVFSTGGGGIAGLGVICDASQKAQGVTGLPSPVGDPFDVDYVAHEMGHQFSGNHTFNSNSQGSCAGNASMGHNYEPGSGSTIMAYAGICGSHDLQSNSDPIFHTESYNEIFNFTIFGAGNSCPQLTFTNNTPPTINLLNDYIIPFRTPFILTGSAFDADGDPLTYIWEQYDFGNFGAPNTPTGNAPTFRDFTPVLDSARTFPRLVNIINNNNINGERLPTYARTMHFKFTARDNRTGGGGVSNNFVPVVVDVINTVNPFLVTLPNTNSVVWLFGANEQVTWDVSSTDMAPINCANVNIRLSLDGGLTFPHVLAANTPNDGSETVAVVGSFGTVNTSQARIKVEAVGNIFFDMSNANFTIQNPNSVNSLALNQGSIQVYPNPGNEIVNVELNAYFTGKTQVMLVNCFGQIVKQVELEKKQSFLKVAFDLNEVPSGVYFLEAKTISAKATKRFVKI